MYARETKRRDDEEALDDWFDLADTVGLGRMNGRRDVFKVESILADAGDVDFAGTNGPAGYGHYTLDDGVRKYQKRTGLKVDGWLRPESSSITCWRRKGRTVCWWRNRQGSSSKSRKAIRLWTPRRTARTPHGSSF